MNNQFDDFSVEMEEHRVPFGVVLLHCPTDAAELDTLVFGFTHERKILLDSTYKFKVRGKREDKADDFNTSVTQPGEKRKLECLESAPTKSAIVKVPFKDLFGELFCLSHPLLMSLTPAAAKVSHSVAHSLQDKVL